MTHPPAVLTFLVSLVLILPSRTLAVEPSDHSVQPSRLKWQSLPDLPNDLGVAGPFVGIHNDCLIVAGGANFPQPVWESEKQWHDRVYVLEHASNGYAWKDGGRLPRRIAYGAAVSTDDGIVCMGGNDAEVTFDHVFLLRWNPTNDSIEQVEYPPLPRPCAYGQATLINDVIYLAGGQSGGGLDTAMNNFWALDLSQKDKPQSFHWQELKAWSEDPRAFNLTAQQHNGYEDCVYVISGRRNSGEDIEFLRDTWEFAPRTRSLATAPRLAAQRLCGNRHRLWAKPSVCTGGR